MGPDLNNKEKWSTESSIPGATTVRERKISNISVAQNHFWEHDFPGKQEHMHIDSHSEKKGHLPEIFESETQSSQVKKVKLVTRKSTQFLAAISANMGAFALGAVLAWSATALPSIRRDSVFSDMNKSQEAWIGSLVTVGALLSCPAAAWAMVTFGRRKSMMILTMPFVIGWILIAFATQVPAYVGHPIYTIYFGRVLTGFCGGAFTVIAPVFVAETAHEKLRGGLASGFDLMLSVGMLYIYVIGAYTTWQIQALACGLIPIAFHLLAMLVPESPRFLVEQGRFDEAAKSLSWLFGIKTEMLGTELAMLKKSVEESQAKPVNFDRVILKMSVLKPMLICIAVMFFYSMSAIDAVIFYAVDIFKSTGTAMDPADSTIILGAVQVVATLPAAFIVDKCGRRILLVISNVFMCISLAAMGGFFYLTNNDDELSHLHAQYEWLPLTALNVFLIAYSIGIGPLSMILLGELVPSHIKGFTSCTALMVRWGLGFAVTNLFETLEDEIGNDKTYWLFAGICGLGVVFVHYCIPETKGKSLDDIQIGFIHPSKLKAQAAAAATVKLNNNLDVELNTHET